MQWACCMHYHGPDTRRPVFDMQHASVGMFGDGSIPAFTFINNIPFVVPVPNEGATTRCMHGTSCSVSPVCTQYGNTERY